MVAMEAERLAADQQLVAIPQRSPIDDAFVVEEGAVATFQVFDEEAALLADDRGVAAADRGHIERHVAVAVAANDGPIAVHDEPRARGTLSNQFQERHRDRPMVTTNPWMLRARGEPSVATRCSAGTGGAKGHTGGQIQPNKSLRRCASSRILGPVS
jgi:hypothetical protein